ncbi:hypothetical protein [Vibrio sp. 10N.222.54.F10]|uniref:hypothetical protein n=1 Tax=Vibrio sp. 10N.222.54.F10 TaxID=1884469 RepID=UPI000CB2C46A|nr:hypothetical protein [Vibrio sp. 10N.222.54.F10]PMO20005.1 hypothetical protein BCT17_21540 [Vibrio sp. 10N.222.54.F10]
MRYLVFFLSVIFLFGCSSMNDALTPSVKVDRDQFDGRTVISQAPVSAASSLSEGWHVMGFDWNSQSPSIIYITIGRDSIVNVEGVEFNVDGSFLTNIQTVSLITEYGDWSTRRFKLPMSDFRLIAKSEDTKMKVITINNYSVSSFGKSNSGAVVNTKFKPFLEEVDKAIEASK